MRTGKDVECLVEYLDARGESAEEVPMTVQPETQSGVTMRRFAFPTCPICNDVLCAAAASEFVSARQIRHQWSCDTCGHEFSTSVRLSFHSERAAALS